MTDVEQLARHRIDNILKSLGWSFEGDNRNVFLEAEGRKLFPKLGKNRPDYLLLNNNKEALAVIEAKADKTKFDKCIQKTKKYAQLTNAPLFFVSDGFIHIARTKDNGYITRDGEAISELLSERDILSFLDNGDISTPDRTIRNQNSLIDKYKTASDILRGEGMQSGLESFYEFCAFLFIKLASEQLRIQPNYHWDTLRNKSGETLIEQYKIITDYFKNNYDDIFRERKIEKSVTIKKLVDLLDGIDFTKTDIDIKGGAYEYFLSRYSKAKKSDLGQYFTPRHIVGMMANILSPDYKKRETIYDPFCGTGGMLVCCYKKMIAQTGSNDDDIDFIKHKTFWGQDNTKELSQIAKMNMILIGDGSTNIKRLDSLDNPVSHEYDIVITNIPFNLAPVSQATANKYGTSNRNANSICIRHCLKSLKGGGRGAIIVPETIGYSDAYKEIRDYLLDTCKIKAIIRLPRAVFKQYTAARTFIIWFAGAHQEKTKKTYVIDIKHDGFSGGVWREPIDKNDIPDFLLKSINLSKHYRHCLSKNINRNVGCAFFSQSAKETTVQDGVRLRDLIIVKDNKQKLSPNKLYKEPRLSSATNTITQKGESRLGKNIKGGGRKVMIEPGDLVIGALHTQRENGLFAISNDRYIATSQIVAKIKPNVNKHWLTLMLRKYLPLLRIDDLTGRENYSKDDILDIVLPPPPPKKVMNKYENLFSQRDELDEQIKTIEESILKASEADSDDSDLAPTLAPQSG